MRRRETLIICQQKISIIRQIMRKTKPKMEKSRLQYNHVIGKVITLSIEEEKLIVSLNSNLLNVKGRLNSE